MAVVVIVDQGRFDGRIVEEEEGEGSKSKKLC